MRSETIAAISTGMTASGISIVRISGPDAVSAADSLFSGRIPLRKAESHTLHHGFIEKDGVSYDEVLVAVMRAPRTYTGEDVVEINCHGGLFVARKILNLVLSEGVSLAEPGEFTKRAFLNGRMDLSKAESVAGVIASGNDYALQAGVSGLKGRIEETVRRIRDRLLDEISAIEAALDDPEHYDLTGYGPELLKKLDPIEAEVRDLLARSERGSLLREGIKTVIAGRPNAGKSSLLNLLSGFEKSIVTEIPGTTRDVIEETVNFAGLSLILMDTAGIRDTEDLVEKIGVDRAKDALSKADLVLYVIDAASGRTEADEKALCGTDPEKVIVLYNKADTLPEDADKTGFRDGILFSCRTEQGLPELEEAVSERFLAGKISLNEEVILTSERQIGLLREAAGLLQTVRKSASEGVSEEFLSADLLLAYTELGKIIGEDIGDDVADRVFEKFCMGK